MTDDPARSIWFILGIETTQDPRAVHRAYAARLKVTRPEDDPSEFQTLVDARQRALDWIKLHTPVSGQQIDSTSRLEVASPPLAIAPYETPGGDDLVGSPAPDRPSSLESLQELEVGHASQGNDSSSASDLIQLDRDLKALTTPYPCWDTAAWGKLLHGIGDLGIDARVTVRTMVIKALIPHLPAPNDVADIPKSFDSILQVVHQIEACLGLAANRSALLAGSDRAATARYGDWVRLCERSRALGRSNIEADNRIEINAASFAPEDLRSALPEVILFITLQAVHVDGNPDPTNWRLRRLLTSKTKRRLVAQLAIRSSGYGALAGLPWLGLINLAALGLAYWQGRNSYGALFGSAGILVLARCLTLLGIAWLAVPLALRRVQRVNAARVINPVERSRRLRPRVPFLLGRGLNLVDFGSLLFLADVLIEGVTLIVRT